MVILIINQLKKIYGEISMIFIGRLKSFFMEDNCFIFQKAYQKFTQYKKNLLALRLCVAILYFNVNKSFQILLYLKQLQYHKPDILSNDSLIPELK